MNEKLNYEKELLNFINEISLLEINKLYSEGKIEKALDRCNKLIIKITEVKLCEWINNKVSLFTKKYFKVTIEQDIKTINDKIINNPSDSDLYMHLGDKYARGGDLSEAIVEYQKAINLNPNNINAILSLMEVLLWQKQYKETGKVYEKHISKITSPESKVIASWIICTAFALDGKDYEKYLEPMIENGHKIDDIPYSIEDILPYFKIMIEEDFNRISFIKAIELYMLISRIKIGSEINKIELENGLTQDIPDDIRKTFLEIIINIGQEVGSMRNEVLSKTYEQRGLISRIDGEIDLAIKDYIIATIYDPTNDNAYIEWGRCLVQRGMFESAITKYRRAYEMNKGNFMSLVGKMEVEICIGNYKNAIKIFKKMVKDNLSIKEEFYGKILYCISLSLEGKSYNKLMKDLVNTELKLDKKYDWYNIGIDRHLKYLELEGFDPIRVANSKKIQSIFENRFMIN